MATTAPLLWRDGALVASAEANVPLLGHAVQRGSLVFDVGAFHDTPRGPALFRAADNVARLLESARIVGLRVGFDAPTLLRAAVDVVRASGVADGIVRYSVFYATREPDLLPADETTSVAIAAMALDLPATRPPIAVATFADMKKPAEDAIPPAAKAAGAYLGSTIGRRRAIAAGASEIVLLDRDGDIAEAPTANAFAIIGGALWTPPLGRILPGITRATVLAFAHAHGIPVREERLPREAFQSADEAFITATTLPITPIVTIDGRSLAAPGPITKRLTELVVAARRGRDPAHESWLTYVSGSA